MSFSSFIISFTESFRDAWNAKDMEALADLVDEDIELTMPKISFSNRAIQPEVVRGRTDFISFTKKLIGNLPMRYTIIERNLEQGKVIKIKIHYYEIDVWCWFECTFSDYGRYKKLRLLHYEDTHSKKITQWRVLRNIVLFKVKRILSIKKKTN